MHRCKECPGTEQTQNFMLNHFKNKYDDDTVSDITFKLWVTTDWSDLITQTPNAEGFMPLFCEKLDKITAL